MKPIGTTGMAILAVLAAAGEGALAQALPSAPQTFGVRTMSFDIWCLETQRLPAERCKQRRPEDLKAFDDYRQVVERYELQYLRQMQRERDTFDAANRDINSTVLDKAIGTR